MVANEAFWKVKVLYRDLNAYAWSRSAVKVASPAVDTPCWKRRVG